MARGLHRYAEMELRYGKMSANGFLPFRTVSSSGDIVLPRGDFRISVVGAGGGGSFYQSNINTSGTYIQNTTGYFTGNFGVGCGGRGGVVVFDVHIPANGIVATCTVGAGGIGGGRSSSGKASDAPASSSGCLSKIVISDLSITVQANGGHYGYATSSATGCKPGAGGKTSYSGVIPVLNISEAAAEIDTIDTENPEETLYGGNFATKLDVNYDRADISEIAALYGDTDTVWAQLREYSPESDEDLLSKYGYGGDGNLSVAYNSETEKYTVLGYDIEAESETMDWSSYGETTAGGDGVIVIERR